MDLLSLLTGSENLYKYLFIGGIGLFVLGLIYPLEKRYALHCQKDNYNNEVKLLNLDINELDKCVQQLIIEKNHAIAQLDSAGKLPVKNQALVHRLQTAFSNKYDSVKLLRRQLSLKTTATEHSGAKIKTLENHIEEYKLYEVIFFWVGLLALASGIVGWYWMMKKASN